MSKWIHTAALAFVACAVATSMNSAYAAVEPAAPNETLARMPVREITVFKDGTAYVLREGVLPTDANGDVQMDDLPTPVLGTFWVYATGEKSKVVSVSARQRRVLVERTALTVPQLIEANPGAEVGIEPPTGTGYGARIIGIPRRTAEELERTSPPNTGERLPEKAGIVLLRTAEGTTATGLDRIASVTFKGDVKPTLADEEFRNLLTVRLTDTAPKSSAGVGMMYVEKGVRWIPSYKITVDGKGNARVALQATLINDVADLDGVTMNLVIGVPTFAFADTPDPISLQQTFAQVSPYMDRDARSNFAFSNAIMTQTAGFGGGGFAAATEAGRPAGPEVAGADRTEDFYVFTVKNITLRKGERVVVPLSERTLKYKDVYTLLLPFGPPPELRQSIGNQQQAEVARLLAAPKVQHKIRITNGKDEPLTTAPALIMRGDRALAQGLMTYTPMGGELDLPVTAAVDVTAKKSERETDRTPDALKWNNESFARVDLKGTVTLTNHRDQTVDLEVTRYVLGAVDTVDHKGEIEKVNVFDDLTSAEFVNPQWWGYYSWPYWWGHVNGIGRITWTVQLTPGKSADLGYTWHYFWR